MNDLHISYFLSIAENSSFTKTAQKFFVSQPAVSRVIASLENELGVTLFDRTLPQTKLTPAGEIFYNAFRQASELIQEASRAANALNDVITGDITIGILSGLDISEHFFSVLDAFCLRYPKISIQTSSAGFFDLRNSLQTGELDIILTLEDSLSPAPYIESKTIAQSSRLLLYSKRHPIALEKVLTPEMFRDIPFLVVKDKGHKTELIVAQYCKPYGFTPKTISVQNIDSLIAGVQNLQGVAIVDGWSREKTNSSFGFLTLNSSNNIVLGWHPNCKNPVLPIFLNEIIANVKENDSL